MVDHNFGGNWTDQKLIKVEKYLKAYTTIMNKYKRYFSCAYIDAFAGTGYRSEEQKNSNNDQYRLFDDSEIEEVSGYSLGSASIALNSNPEFDKYIFIEKYSKHFKELEKLKDNFPNKKSKILLKNQEANEYLLELCLNSNWKKHRAVLFLDPYGMQVNWSTIEAIAKTQAIDLWYLFPIGMGLNRMLQKNVDAISDSWKNKLNEFLGTEEWQEGFYQREYQNTLFFGTEEKNYKDADFDKISKFFVKRLESIFPGVAKNPLLLRNSRSNPLYLLCFAAGNPKGAPTAVRIAQNILSKE